MADEIIIMEQENMIVYEKARLKMVEFSSILPSSAG